MQMKQGFCFIVGLSMFMSWPWKANHHLEVNSPGDTLAKSQRLSFSKSGLGAPVCSTLSSTWASAIWGAGLPFHALVLVLASQTCGWEAYLEITHPPLHLTGGRGDVCMWETEMKWHGFLLTGRLWVTRNPRHLPQRRQELEGWMARSFAALSEDLSLVPSTHIQWLKIYY